MIGKIVINDWIDQDEQEIKKESFEFIGKILI